MIAGSVANGFLSGQPRPFRSWWPVITILVLVVIAAVLAAHRPAARPQPPTFDRLRTGECLTGSNLVEPLQYGAPWPAKTRSVPCTSNHLAEVVFSGVGWRGYTTYPGAKTVSSEAATACRHDFAAYVAHHKTPTGFSVAALVPDNPNWSAGNRQLVCVVYAGSTAGIDFSIRGQAS